MEDRPIKVLLVEDSADDADLLVEALAEVSSARFRVDQVERFDTMLEYLDNEQFDIVLLDLSLPDSQGIETFVRIRGQAPGVPVVVLTGLDDETVAVRALHEGAQDYLVKGKLDSDVLVRSIRYALERHRLQVELGQVRQQEQQEQEFRSLEQLSRAPRPTAATPASGPAPLRESRPDSFDELVRGYEELLGLALEEQAYKMEHNIAEKLSVMGGQLGVLNAGPRDVVMIHSTALKRKAGAVNPQEMAAFIEEGRLMVLGLMGCLAAHMPSWKV